MLGDPAGFHSDIEGQIPGRMRHYKTEERQLMLRMLKLRRRLLALDIYIDNAELSDFLDGFRTINCAETYCENCRYCHRYAERAVRFDRAEADILAADISKLLEESLTV